MTIRKIARMGHDVLKQVSEPIADPTAPEIAQVAISARAATSRSRQRENSA